VIRVRLLVCTQALTEIDHADRLKLAMALVAGKGAS
jgi:hypothetical protein